MATSSNHRARRLDPAQIDYHDRWGKLCTAGRHCPGAATHLVTYDYVTGRAGRISDSSRLACETHATRFAAKHQVEIGDPQPERPSVFDAVSAFNHDRVRITLRRDAYRRWYGQESGAGFFVSHAYRLDLPENTPIDDAITAVEHEAGTRKGLARHGEWTRTDLTAVAEFVKAEDTDQWRNAPWTLRVHCVADGWDTGTWVLTRTLDPRFGVQVDRLGDTHMDLDRAIRTATKMLPTRWTILADWTRDGDTATTTARRGPKPPPAQPTRLIVAARGVPLTADLPTPPIRVAS